MDVSLDRMLAIVGAIGVPAAIGVGIAMDPKTVAELRFSQACLIVSALIIVGFATLWAVTSDAGFMKRIATTAVLFSIAGVTATEGSRWAEQRHSATKTEGAQPETVQPNAEPLRPVTIFWATPAPIVAGTPLSNMQLNAKAAIEGVLAYNPDIGTVLPVGRHPLTVTFNPTDAKSYQSASETVYLVVNPAPAVARSERKHEQTTPPPATAPSDSEAFQTEKPILVILPKTLNPPSIVLSKSPASSFEIKVENRGRHFARNVVLSAKMMFLGREGINSPKEMRAVCEHPSSLYTASDGPSIAPGDLNTLNGSAISDLEGIDKEINDPNATLWGFLVTCVNYHSDLNDRTLRTAFTFIIGIDLSKQQLKDLQEHAAWPAYIPPAKIFFTPDRFSPYDY
jgi:hypothetical protein